MTIITAFNTIRDIPYRIPLSTAEEDNCCSGKARRFKKILEDAGYRARYRVCEFQWSDMELPESVRSVPHENQSTHVYLEVLINNQWIDVDPTWDCAIERILPVADWDGQTSTIIAVKSLQLFSHEESKKIMEEEDIEEVEEDLKKNGAFYKAFNEWLQNERS